MMTRLKPFFAMLLALVVCGASSQAAVCELSCGFEAQRIACHMAADPQPAAMQSMPHGHCSPAMHSAPGEGKTLSSPHQGSCGHAASPAVENAFASKARLAVMQRSFFRTASAEHLLPHTAAFAVKRSPPLAAAANPLLVTLRI